MEPLPEPFMEIRPLSPNDRARWQQLWLGYLDFYQAQLPEEQHDLTWHRLLDPEEPMYAIGACEDGEVIGIAHYHFYRSCWLPTVNCYLQDLFTDPEHRGKGVGTALIEAVADAARARGAGGLWWMTQANNDTARRVYDQVAQDSGFIKYVKPL